MDKQAIIKALRDTAQSASNSVAETASAPIDAITWALRKAGLPVPENAVGSSDWMAQKGLTAPVDAGIPKMAGEVLGNVVPAIGFAKAPQIARGMNRMVDNAMAPTTLNKQRGVVGVPSYGMSHRPMTVEGGAATLDNLTPAFGDDIYSKNALQYFGSGDAREKAAVAAMNKVKGNPDAMVTIYRGVPDKNSAINAGDWVTLSPEVAADYGNVISMQVPARDVTSWADSLLEFGYYPKGK